MKKICCLLALLMFLLSAPASLSRSSAAGLDRSNSKSSSYQTAGFAALPYLGSWTVVSVEMNNGTYPAADLGVAMTLTLKSDGTCETSNNGATSTVRWTLSSDGARVDGVLCVLQEDGTLRTDQDGFHMILSRSDGIEATPQPTPEKDDSHLYGTWNVTKVRIGNASYAARDYGLDAYMLLQPDGTYVLESSTGSPENGFWHATDDGVTLDSVTMLLQDDGTLLADFGEYGMVFEHDLSQPDVTASPAPTPRVTASPAPTPFVEEEDERAPYTGTWQAISVIIEGKTYNAADIDLDLSIILNAGGSAISLNPEEGRKDSASWDVTQDGILLDGVRCILREDGTLLTAEGKTSIVFARVSENEVPVPEETPDERTAFLGVWSVTEVLAGGISYSAVDAGLDARMILYEDDTYTLESNTGDPETGAWQVTNHGVQIGNIEMLLLDDGTLLADFGDSGMVFRHDISNP